MFDFYYILTLIKIVLLQVYYKYVISQFSDFLLIAMCVQLFPNYMFLEVI